MSRVIETNLEILKALGIDPSHTVSVDLSIRINALPLVTITRHVWNAKDERPVIKDGKVETIVQRFTLQPYYGK